MESCSHNGVVAAGSRKTGRAFSLAARFMAAFKMALVFVAFRATGYRWSRGCRMTISGGMPTIFVSDMDAAVRFYLEALGLKLLERYGDHWASIDAGHGLTIGLHPASAQNPAGRVGSMTIGFRSSEPIRETVAKLKARGVVFRGDIRRPRETVHQAGLSRLGHSEGRRSRVLTDGRRRRGRHRGRAL